MATSAPEEAYAVDWQDFRALVEQGEPTPLRSLLAQCREAIAQGRQAVMIHRLTDPTGNTRAHVVRTFSTEADLEKLSQDIERAIRIARDFAEQSD